MIRTLHTLAVFFYWLGLQAGSAFHPKARKAVTFRRNWKKKLVEHARSMSGLYRVWIHCSSYGEYQDIKRIAYELNQLEDVDVYYTFESPTGYECSSDIPQDRKLMAPVDFIRNFKFFIKTLKPKTALFSRSELWLNRLTIAHAFGTSVHLLGFRVAGNTNYLKPWMKQYYRLCFQVFHTIFCEDENASLLLKRSYGLSNSLIIGDPRMAQILASKSHVPSDILRLEELKSGVTIVLGSLEMSDLSKVLPAVETEEVYHWIICPHEPSDSMVRKMQQVMGSRPLERWSDIKGGTTFPKLLLVDTVGELRWFYALADLSYVGGGFTRRGIHNVFEPAVFGTPVCSGPNYRDYSVAAMLLKTGQLTLITNCRDFLNSIRTMEPRNLVELPELKSPRFVAQEISKNFRAKS